jgi:iron(III) transport system ATP-binding protein
VERTRGRNLSCEGVWKAYGDRAVLCGLDLAVAAGTFTAVLGASGAGKSTLLRTVMGLERLDDGVVRVGETVLSAPGTHVPTERRRMGYVSQEGALFPQLKVAENVGFGLERAERKSGLRVAEVLELVGLGSTFADRQPRELSGGEQRRVALARALAPRPDLVLLDEPFSGLDAALRAETRQAVLAALGAAGATAVLVTHDQAEALSMGHVVGVMRGGRLVQVAEPEILYRQPADVGVARFVGEAVVLAGVRTAGTVTCVLGTLPASGPAADGAAEVMIRPEQIRMSEVPVGDHHGPVARVTARRFLGSEVVVSLVLLRGYGPDAEGLALVARTVGHDAPAEGERVVLAVNGTVMAYPPLGPRSPEEADAGDRHQQVPAGPAQAADPRRPSMR